MLQDVVMASDANNGNIKTEVGEEDDAPLGGSVKRKGSTLGPDEEEQGPVVKKQRVRAGSKGALCACGCQSYHVRSPVGFADGAYGKCAGMDPAFSNHILYLSFKF